jgi:hypothetical protein
VANAFDVLGAAGSLAGVVGAAAQFYALRRERATRDRPMAGGYPGHPAYPPAVSHSADAAPRTATIPTSPVLPGQPAPVSPSSPVSPGQPDTTVSPSMPGPAPRPVAGSPAPAVQLPPQPVYAWHPPAARRRSVAGIIAGIVMNAYLWLIVIAGFGTFLEPYDATIPADQLPSNMRVMVVLLLINALWAAALTAKHARRRPPSTRRWLYAGAGVFSFAFALLLLVVDANLVF